MVGKIILGIHLSKEQHRGLKVEAAKQEITMNKVLRELIDLFISGKIVLKKGKKKDFFVCKDEPGVGYSAEEKELWAKIKREKSD